MHPSISINTLSLAAEGLGKQLDTVARLGARAASPDLEQVHDFGIPATARHLRDVRLEVAALTHRAFTFATPAATAAGRERLMRTIDIAAQIGAKSIVLTTGERGDFTWPEAAARFAEAIAPCSQHARVAGITLGIEQPSHLYADESIAHRLSDSLRIADQAKISVTLDIFACWFDADIDEMIAAAGLRINLVQVSDYVYGDRGLPCRAVPGDGAVPLERLIPAIALSGFNGWFDLEIIGPRLQAEGQEPGLTRAASYIGSLLNSADVVAT